MKGIMRWILSVLGYGGYTVAVVLFLLWFLFPTDSFRVWLQNQLENSHPELEWKVKELRLAWPLSIVAAGIQAADAEAEKPLIYVEEVKVRPDFNAIKELTNKYSFKYRLNSLNGSVIGTLSVEREGRMIDCSGQIKEMQVGGLEEFWRKAGRTVKGKMSGTFDYAGEWQNLVSGQLQADLVMKDGSIELLQPVMGLEKLDFNQLNSSLSSKNQVVTMTGGKIESTLFAVDFSGNVTMNDNLLDSSLDINGSFEPRPELFGNLQDAAMVKLVKDQLRDGKLSFKVTDTLMTPGIIFQGVSGVIDGVINGGIK